MLHSSCPAPVCVDRVHAQLRSTLNPPDPTRPDPTSTSSHSKTHWAPLVLILVSSRLVSSIFLFLSYCPFFMSSTSLFLFLLSLSCWFAQVLHSFEELKAHRSLISFHDELSEARQVMKLAFSLMDIVTHHTHPKRPVCI